MIPLTNAVGNPPTAPPEDIYVPMPTSVPSVAAPAPAPVPPAPAPAPSPIPVSAPAPTPHQQCHPRLHLCRTPRLLSPRALVANWLMRVTWICLGGRVARPVHCAIHHGNTPIAMVYHWTTRPWCQCWKKAKQCMRLYVNTAPLRTYRPRMHRTYLHRTMCPTLRCRLFQTHGDTPCIESSMVSYRQVLSRRRRHSKQSQTWSMLSRCTLGMLMNMVGWLRLSRG